MGFDSFVLVSLLFAALAVRFVLTAWPQRSAIFDRRVTGRDRAMIMQTAFFVLIPLSVALHELGHALAIWSFGGRVVDFGYYGFAGYVSYDPSSFSELQRMIVAAAGAFMNLILIAAAMAIVLVRRTPLGPAWNELLLQFAGISALLVFVAYPLMDVASDVHGDWRQIYGGSVRWFAALVAAVHISVLALGVALGRAQWSRRRMAERTALDPTLGRGVLGPRTT